MLMHFILHSFSANLCFFLVLMILGYFSRTLEDHLKSSSTFLFLSAENPQGFSKDLRGPSIGTLCFLLFFFLFF